MNSQRDVFVRSEDDDRLDDEVDVEQMTYERHEDLYFDSRDHRLCGRLPAKTAAFVLVTWVAHEIALAAIFVGARAEDLQISVITLAASFFIRLLQLVGVFVLYIGIWRHIKLLLLPFAIMQYSFGIAVDLWTLRLAVEHVEKTGERWPSDDWSISRLNVGYTLLIYFSFDAALLYTLIRCYIYLEARAAAEKANIRARQAPLIATAANGTKTSNTALAPRTQNAIAMKSIKRSSSKFSVEQLRLRRELLAIRNSATGSLQQLPAALTLVNNRDSTRRLSNVAHDSLQESSAPNLRSYIAPRPT